MLHFCDSRPAEFAQAEQVLGGLPQALFIVRAPRQLIFANPPAESLVAAGLVVCPGHELMAAGQLGAKPIGELLQRAAGCQKARAGLWFERHQRTGWLDVSLMANCMLEGSDWPRDSLLMIVHLDEPALTQGARIEALCQQCRLTATERYVLLLLADGLSVESAARQLGLQVSTLRTHVRNLLGKSRAPSLMQLVRWLGSAQPLVL